MVPLVLSREVLGDVVQRVTERVAERSRSGRGPGLDEVAFETVYAERGRLARSSLDQRSRADREFLADLRSELSSAGERGSKALVERIVRHYVEEIAGHFDPRVYRWATAVVPRALSMISRGQRGGSERAHDDLLAIEGQSGMLRELSSRGTVILAPTHVSHLDSLVMGLVLHRLGLPPFAYGAGLNLFANPMVGFFLQHLGAYTVDRRKSDPLYRETLKEYVTVLLERGQHNLLFPGGTRSRSGAVETHLKKGLLGTAPVAFRHAVQARSLRPGVFVVPCTLSYPLVLEASTLIGDFLRTEGGPHYLDRQDEFASLRRWWEYLRSAGQLGQRVHVRFSRALDWLGNDVDPDGTSRDPKGRRVAPEDYLRVAGRLVEDAARDAEYTRQLSLRIVAAFRRELVALPTQLAAFVCFERLYRQRGQADLFHFLRGPVFDVDVKEVLSDIARAQSELALRKAEGAIQVADEVSRSEPSWILNQALRAFASYHREAVLERAGERLRTRDPELLLYYRNRLEGYGLLGARDVLHGVGVLGGRRPR